MPDREARHEVANGMLNLCRDCPLYLGFSTRIGDQYCLPFERIPLQFLNGTDKCPKRSTPNPLELEHAPARMERTNE